MSSSAVTISLSRKISMSWMNVARAASLEGWPLATGALAAGADFKTSLSLISAAAGTAFCRWKVRISGASRACGSPSMA